MKSVIKNLLVVMLLILVAKSGFAGGDTTYVKPTYRTVAKQVSLSPTELVFDLFIKHTNLNTTRFEYAGGQYFFKTTLAYRNSGFCTFRYSADTLSDLPRNMIPRNPSMSVYPGTGDTILMRLAINTFPGAGNGYIVPDTGVYGARIIRLKFTNVTSTFAGQPGQNIKFQNGLPNPYTKIFAYTGLNGTVNTEITDSLNHIIDFPTGIGSDPGVTINPTEFSLSQNYPNPFNPSTKITYAIPVEGNVTLKVFDLTGREIMNLVNEPKQVGFHTVDFNGANLASGVYFYRINVDGVEGNNYKATRRMVLIK
ncbi:MAG: T9SS type A sorting domain-containing protein [Ignavibacteria bacterium]